MLVSLSFACMILSSIQFFDDLFYLADTFFLVWVILDQLDIKFDFALLQEGCWLQHREREILFIQKKSKEIFTNSSFC